MRYPALGDDIVAVLDGLGIASADLWGYSFGGGACLRAAIQHSARVRRLVVVGFPCRRDGWLPDVIAQMARVDAGTADMLRQTEVYVAWRAVAPDPAAFDAVVAKMGDLLRQPYDWSDDVRGLRLPVMIAVADADSVAPRHAVEFSRGRGRVRDGGWDGSARPTSRLATVPGRTHFDVWSAPTLIAETAAFLDAELGGT